MLQLLHLLRLLLLLQFKQPCTHNVCVVCRFVLGLSTNIRTFWGIFRSFGDIQNVLRYLEILIPFFTEPCVFHAVFLNQYVVLLPNFAGNNQSERETYSHRMRTKATMLVGINPISNKKIELRILAAMDSCFGLVRPCQHGIANT